MLSLLVTGRIIILTILSVSYILPQETPIPSPTAEVVIRHYYHLILLKVVVHGLN